MKKFLLLFFSLTFVFYLSSCSSGVWEDDNKNWERAFKVTLPEEIDIKHSWYWRSPHFTFECEYFFEVQYSESVAEEFRKGDDLVKIDSTEYEHIRFFNEKPKWFIPNDFNEYEIWRSKGHETYFLFIDKKKKSIFFTEYQT